MASDYHTANTVLDLQLVLFLLIFISVFRDYLLKMKELELKSLWKVLNTYRL